IDVAENFGPLSLRLCLKQIGNQRAELRSAIELFWNPLLMADRVTEAPPEFCFDVSHGHPSAICRGIKVVTGNLTVEKQVRPTHVLTRKRSGGCHKTHECGSAGDHIHFYVASLIRFRPFDHTLQNAHDSENSSGGHVRYLKTRHGGFP